MENEDQQNEGTDNEQQVSEEQGDEKPSVRRKKAPCPDCVKNGKSTGLQDARTLCATCDGSGSVKAVV